MKAFIFAAGLGTRLRPLTDSRPKALVPYHGRPMIDIVIERLSAQGIDGFVVNVHHFAEQIIKHISERADVSRFRISDESTLLRDTGGAIRYAINQGIDLGECFLVHNVDIISNFSLPDMVAALRPDAVATLLVSERVTSRYLLFNNDMRLVGWTNTATGEVRSPYRGLETDKCLRRAFSGIHIINICVGRLMQSWPDVFSIIDFYLSVCADHPIYGYEQPGLEVKDIGKISQLQ